MTAEVNFHPDGFWHVVRFDYDPELVGLVKQLPSFARRWQPEDKSWRVATPYANRLAYGTHAHGYLITGLEPEPGTNPPEKEGLNVRNDKRQPKGPRQLPRTDP